MTNINMLIDAIEKNGKTKEAVAEAAGMDRATFYRKIQKNGDSFTVEQVREMASFIPLTKKEVHEIFLM